MPSFLNSLPQAEHLTIAMVVAVVPSAVAVSVAGDGASVVDASGVDEEQPISAIVQTAVRKMFFNVTELSYSRALQNIKHKVTNNF
jgi:hypothetical protein